MRHLLFILLFSLVASLSAHAQTLIYDVVKGGEKIGELKALKNTEGRVTKYALTSKVTVSIFIDVVIESAFKSTYKSGYLYSGSTTNKRDGKVKEYNTLEWNGEAYDISQNGNMMTFATPKKIFYSLNAMYFKEPSRSGRIFSERYGKYLMLKKVGSHKFELDVPGGGSNVYSYKNGICTHVLVDHFLATVEFRLQKSSIITKS